MKIIPGKMFFTKTHVSIGGEAIPDSEVYFLGILMRRRRLPRIGEDFIPTGDYYERWEVIRGNQSWFFATKIEAELNIIEGSRSKG